MLMKKGVYILIRRTLIWLLMLIFVFYYPMFISIYVFLPLFIGFMGFLFIRGIEKKRMDMIVLPLLYFINLNANLSLPYFLITLSVILVYILFYPLIGKLKKCQVCIALFSVFLIDLTYVGSLMLYDFIFQSDSIVLNEVLLYSLMIDLLFAVVLF